MQNTAGRLRIILKRNIAMEDPTVVREVEQSLEDEDDNKNNSQI